MRVVAMFRVSTEKQASEGASLDAQERTYDQWAERMGWTTVAKFKGHESATQASSDRRVLQNVLECVRCDSPDAVYVHEQSRLTRGDQLEVMLLFRELEERKVKVIINGVVRDLDSIDERFMLDIQSVVDRAESARIKERLTRGKRQRAMQGRKNSGPAPFGYLNPPPGSPGRGTLQVVPEEAVVVRRIFELATQGKADKAIANVLNLAGIPSSRGVKWGKTSVARVLTNPAYVGTAASNIWERQGKTRGFKRKMDNPKAILVANAHEAIIDPATWAAVNGRAKNPCTAVPRLLTGLLNINGRHASGDKVDGITYYRGPRGQAGLPWLPSDETDDAVWSALVSLATGEDFVRSLMVQAQDPTQKHTLQMEVEHAEDQVGRLKTKRDRLLDMRAEGEVDKVEFRRRNDENERALEQANRDLAAYRAKLAALDGAAAPRVVRAVRTLVAGRTRLTLAQKRVVLRSIVFRVEIEAVRVKTDYNRDEKGHIKPGKTTRWVVQDLKLQLNLPASDGVPMEPGSDDLGWSSVSVSARPTESITKRQ